MTKTLVFTKAEGVSRHHFNFDGTKKRAEALAEWFNQPMGTFKRKYSVRAVPESEGDGYVLEVRGRTTKTRGVHQVRKGNVLAVCYTLNELTVLEHVQEVSETQDPKLERPPLNEFQMRYIDKVAPDHSRTSCDDSVLYNAWYGGDDVFMGRCVRCTLLQAALGYLPPKEREDDY